jgi:molybdenum cofactor synthesis domain-containing protein
MKMEDRKEFRELVSVEQARDIISRLTIRREVERIPIEMAFGRTLAYDVISSVDVPPFDRAAMDGFALIASDTYAANEMNPVTLKHIGSLPAGMFPVHEVNQHEAMEIATGAMMPKGADAEVMIEYVDVRGDDVVISKAVTIHENVISAGSDVMAGELVLRKKTPLTEREIGALATIGLRDVAVYKKPKVGLLSTGDEILPPGEQMVPGKVYDVNTYSLGAAVQSSGGDPLYYGIVEDDLTKIEDTIQNAITACDIVISSGSTSAGRGDVVYKIAERGELFAHGVSIKPGKPFIIAEIDGKPFFGLPGYPVSALMVYYVFIDPFIRGRTKSVRRVTSKLAIEIHSEPRYHLIPVNLVRGKAYPIEKSSDAITTLLSDGFIEIPAHVEIVSEGEEVSVSLFGELETTDLMFIGSHDVGLDILFGMISDVAPHVKVVNVGSQGGLVAIRKGIADIAGIHLLSESGEYNVPFLGQYGLRKIALVKGYLREQGIITKKGITVALDDLPEKRLINRNKGSGTRVLMDRELKQIAAKRGVPFFDFISLIKGYTYEARTHSAVASAVKFGKADVGIGIRPVAELNGLDFHPIAEEEYDFVIPQDRVTEEAIKKFLEALRSHEFAQSLPAGIRTYERTGEVILFD